VNAAKYVGMEGRLGVVKDGAIADFLVLNKNPLEDITVLDRMSENLLAIVKDGRVVASKVDQLKVDTLYKGLELP
jgi:imidazolonepropionase-like amidohydrolase